MQGEHDKVSWRRIICNSKASPKAIFITWLVLHDRLVTKSRLHFWGVTSDNLCDLCANAEETITYLLFDYMVSKITCKLYL